jgi:hypothetical protein
MLELHATSKTISEVNARFNPPRGWVRIQTNGNKCVHSAVRRKITQGPCYGYNSLWTFIRVDKAFFVKSKNGQVLDVSGGRTNNGAHILAWNKHGGNNQRWQFINIGRGKLLLKNVKSRKCLDNTGSIRRGRRYHQWSCNSRNRNQHIRIIKVRGVPNSWVYIKGPGGLCVQTSTRRITQGSCRGNNALWRFVRYRNKYIIQSKRNRRVFDVAGGARHNGGQIYAWSRHNGSNQMWDVFNNRRRKFMIKNVRSSKCLDNTGKIRRGRGYHQWSCSSGNKNQQFYLIDPRQKRRRPASRIQRISYPKGWGRIKGPGNLCVYATRRKITQGSCSGNNSLWRFFKKGRRNEFVVQSKNGRVLDVYGGRTNKGVTIIAGNKHGRDNQRWSFIKFRKGNFLLRNVRSKKCIDNTGSIRRGRRYHQWYCSKRNRNQWFSFVALPVKKRRIVKKNSSKIRTSKKPNSGYRKKKNIRFMGGKYKFNLVTGKEFCSSKCKPNRSAPVKKCFKGSVQNCNSCAFNGNKKDEKSKDSDELCKVVCNAIDKENTCEFYTYIDDKKKVINKKLLNRFGRIFIKKYLKKK